MAEKMTNGCMTDKNGNVTACYADSDHLPIPLRIPILYTGEFNRMLSEASRSPVEPCKGFTGMIRHLHHDKGREGACMGLMSGILGVDAYKVFPAGMERWTVEIVPMGVLVHVLSMGECVYVVCGHHKGFGCESLIHASFRLLMFMGVESGRAIVQAEGFDRGDIVYMI